jgi:hypothetical protein
MYRVEVASAKAFQSADAEPIKQLLRFHCTYMEHMMLREETQNDPQTHHTQNPVFHMCGMSITQPWLKMPTATS